MGIAIVQTKNATVTKLKPFRTAQGHGVDVYLEAKSNICTVYLQAVVYDEQADTAMQKLHVEDSVDVTGMLRFMKYPKKNGNGVGYSMLVDRPVIFDKHVSGGRIEQIVPFNQAYYMNPESAYTAPAISAQETPVIANTAEQELPDTDELPF